MERVITRGDDYYDDRPIYLVTLVDDALMPYDLTGCTVRSTWRPAPIPPGEDAGDATAALAASITINSSGVVTASDGLMLPGGGSASGGVLLLVADRATTTAMPLTSGLRGDVQITDIAGLVHTVVLVATLATVDGYTSTES